MSRFVVLLTACATLIILVSGSNHNSRSGHRRGQQCSCLGQTSSLACSEDFVVLARARSGLTRIKNMVTNTTGPGYQVDIIQRFKMSPQAEHALRTNILEVTCGARLKPRVLYVVSGRVQEGKARIAGSGCSVIKPWNGMKVEDRNGFRQDFYDRCLCRMTKAAPLLEVSCFACIRPEPGNPAVGWRRECGRLW